jgi:hypothetical protein
MPSIEEDKEVEVRCFILLLMRIDTLITSAWAVVKRTCKSSHDLLLLFLGPSVSVAPTFVPFAGPERATASLWQAQLETLWHTQQLSYTS